MDQERRKEAALHARVSTLDQNCEVQLQDLRRFVGQRFTLYREYIDVGLSGSSPETKVG
jgi:DNA invertase Pin-like site-specific DNA recombinase